MLEKTQVELKQLLDVDGPVDRDLEEGKSLFTAICANTDAICPNIVIDNNIIANIATNRVNE